MPETIDTTNTFLVSLTGERVHILNPPRGPMSQQDALALAAWLVALSLASREDFLCVLDAVEAT